MEEIERMQKHLLLIRRTVGWSAEEMGEKIGVTRQTINNLENGRAKMSKAQYYAIRGVLAIEIIQHPEDTGMLQDLLEILIDKPEEVSKEQYDHLVAKANMIAPSILSGASTREEVSKEWKSNLSLVCGALCFGLGLASMGLGWLPAGIVGAEIFTGAQIAKRADKKKNQSSNKDDNNI